MTHKEYLAIKNYLLKIEKQARTEAEEEGVSPLDIEKYIPEILKLVLESHDINAEEYFKIDSQMDRKGSDRKKLLDEEIDVEELEKEGEEIKVKEKVGSFIKDLMSKFKK